MKGIHAIFVSSLKTHIIMHAMPFVRQHPFIGICENLFDCIYFPFSLTMYPKGFNLMRRSTHR